ncbi:Lar family restriction alleviation protein [Burkholderia cenocepacia]|uniref:Lar family restriction alleviation protein n=1 Tax=Burkholderia cenocepacia TaxID=95486 RepID=UPI00158CF086|nr:Lar family restriction alleviation protein [Burkholderia cenocepacia]
MSNTLTDLLPCPFCGGTNCTVSTRTIGKWKFVYCPDCLAEGPADDMEVVAIADWNRRAAQQPEPVDILLFCPKCGAQHVDAPESKPGRLISSGPFAGRAVAPEITWENPPHRSHLCHACGTIWRPADVPTNGVASIQTRGKADTWDGKPEPRAEVADDKTKRLIKTLSDIIHDQTVAMQSAIIEWQHGNGAEAGLAWIVNTLEGPGHLPDFDAPHGKHAQFWFNANQANPLPTCFCGNPSSSLWMGQGFCCDEHYREARAKYDAARAGASHE